MANIKQAPLLLVLTFLSFPPILPSQNLISRLENFAGKYGHDILHGGHAGLKQYENYIKDGAGDSYDPPTALTPKASPPAMTPKASPPAMTPKASPPIKSSQLRASPSMSPTASPPNMSPTASPPSDNTEAEPIGFYVNFSVGNSSTTWINARMSISSGITFLDNYQPSNSSSYQCCTEELICSKKNCNGDYYVQADTINFYEGNLTNVPYVFNPSNKTQSATTTGFLSFSRSPYSLLSIAKAEGFSYFFSESNSNVTIGPVNYTASVQSTKIITNPDYPHLYYVNLTQISIGSSTKFTFNRTSNSSIVILDTVIFPTLLETGVYAHVKSELNRQLRGSFTDEDTGLELCYSTKQDWPHLTLFFDPLSSNGAQMVLTNDSYVVTVTSGAECAAIYECEGASVIGILAQISREMIFDLSNSGPKLSFSQYPAGSEAAVPTKATLSGILIWSLCVLLYLHIPV